MKARALVVSAAAGAMLALAGTANAQGTSVAGETAEGVAVKLEVGEFGNATAFQIGKVKVGCKRGGTLTTRKTTYTDFDRSDPGVFSGKFGDTSGSGRFKFKATTKVSGAAATDGSGTWSGSFKSKTKVIDDGKQIDTCRLKTSWEAGP